MRIISLRICKYCFVYGIYWGKRVGDSLVGKCLQGFVSPLEGIRLGSTYQMVFVKGNQGSQLHRTTAVQKENSFHRYSAPKVVA